MGLVRVRAQIGRTRQDLVEEEFVVDTGSFYTAISPAVRAQLGLVPGIPERTQLADGRIVDVELTVAHVKIDSREAGVPVEIADVPELLLGVSALEALGMKVNPLTGELEAIGGFDAPPTMKRYHSSRRDPQT